MRPFLAGLCVGLVVAGGAGAWLVHKAETTPVMFPSKNVYDGGNSYHFEGSLYGTGEDRPVNGFMSAWCWQERAECDITTIDDISGGGVSHFVSAPYEETIKVRKWGRREIVADSQGKDPRQCNWYEIKIDRATEEVTYTRIPNKEPTSEVCKDYTKRVMRWRVDNGYAFSSNHDGSPR